MVTLIVLRQQKFQWRRPKTLEFFLELHWKWCPHSIYISKGPRITNSSWSLQVSKSPSNKNILK